MKTDKELLELAAKAAGMNVEYNSGVSCHYYDDEDDCAGRTYWNPLETDGDALRLAVSLCIVFNFIEGDTIQRPQVKAGRMTSLGGVVQIVDSSGWDAATRRAIVRAAAAIGEKL